jgi:hypothetical protein
MTNAATDMIDEPVGRSAMNQPSSDGFFVPFDSQIETAQQVHKLAGRLNASAVSDEEHKDLLAERQQLLDKHFAGTITRKETVRLEYVRWSLDRIEDAKHGASLDRLEARIAEFEKLAEHLGHLQEELNRAASKPQPRRKHNRR